MCIRDRLDAEWNPNTYRYIKRGSK